jgi:hypothetical protein
MKKEATLKCKGLETKTFNEKRGNPKTQGAPSKDIRGKSRQPQDARDSTKFCHRSHEGDSLNQKVKSR